MSTTNVNAFPVPQQQAAPVTAENQSFADFLTGGYVIEELAAGRHKARLAGYAVKHTAEGTMYVSMKLQLEDREIVYNTFETSFRIMMSQAHQQMVGKGKVSVPDILKRMTEQDFDIYVDYANYISKKTGKNERARNINLVAPESRETVTTEAAATTSADPF